MQKNIYGAIMDTKYTLNLTKSNLSVGYAKDNSKFLAYWKANETYHKANQSLPQNNKFVLLDGPPYANGDAHMGHALNKLLKDLVVKSRWFLGQSVDYRPGWDCHGLPLELAVEKTRGRSDAATFKSHCKRLALKSMSKQRSTFNQLGVFGEWEQPYLTLSKEMLSSNWRTLADLFSKNLLTHKQYPVHYCPACASSLAEAELETKSLPKDDLYFKMKLKSPLYPSLFALVWTTTPWTLPMNQALAFNSNFSYQVWRNHLNEHLVLQNPEAVADWLNLNSFTFLYETNFENLLASASYSPLTSLEAPCLYASFVEPGKTGFVHVACAHGPEDFLLGAANGLAPKTCLDANGVFRFSDSDTLYELHNLKHSQATASVLKLLSSNNLLVNHHTVMTEQKVCWRHQCGVYYNATWQVFLELEKPEHSLKDKARSLLSSPTCTMDPTAKSQLEHMLYTRPNWCLSRQRVWGCPMNLLVDNRTNKLDHKTFEFLNLHADGNVDGANELLKDNPNLRVFTDVLDVWFDSGNVVNEYVSREGLQNKLFAVDLVLEGKDQYRGWFQSLLWLSVAKNNVLPYDNLLCHGFVMAEGKAKMSKSKGNGQSVLTYLEAYGGDVLHLWAASQEFGMDAVFSSEKLDSMKSHYSRLRLSLRFLSSNLFDYHQPSHAANLLKYKDMPEFDLHRYVLTEMHDLAVSMEEDFQKFNFKNSLEALYLFCEKTLSNFYFDWSKNVFYLSPATSEERLMLQTASHELFLGLTDMVKVFAPFLAEEFHQEYLNNSMSVFESQYFTAHKHSELSSMQPSLRWADVQSTKRLVQVDLEKMQQSKTVKSRTEVLAQLHLAPQEFHTLSTVSNLYRLGGLLSVSDASLQENDKNFVSLLDLKQDASYCKCPRCWNYELLEQFAGGVCSYCA